MRRNYNWSIVSNTKLRSIPSTSGICIDCTKCGTCEVGLKAKTGRTIFPEPFGLQFGAEKRIPNLSDIQILPELFGDEVFFMDVKTNKKLGGFKVEVPLVISALGSTKVAYVNREELSKGAALSGIIRVVGENILPTYGEKGLKECIKPFLDNYTGNGGIVVQANVHDQKLKVPEISVKLGAQAVEIKFGQGAKQGLGGEIRFSSKKDAERYKKLGYRIIEKNGEFERHSSPGSLKKEEVEKRLKEYSKLNVPLWIKIGIGRDIFEFLYFMKELKDDGVPIEAVTIDGHGGGTGMSPWLIMNETSLPSCFIFSKIKKLNFDIIVSGGICDGMDCAKAIMLGADGVAMGRAFLIAAQVGKENGIKNFVNAIKEELQMVCAALRKDSLDKIKGMKENLFPLSEEAKEIFGLENNDD